MNHSKKGKLRYHNMGTLTSSLDITLIDSWKNFN